MENEEKLKQDWAEYQIYINEYEDKISQISKGYVENQVIDKLMYKAYQSGGIKAAEAWIQENNEWLEILKLVEYINSRFEDLKNYHAKDKSKG